jgi:hypothetical protein
LALSKLINQTAKSKECAFKKAGDREVAAEAKAIKAITRIIILPKLKLQCIKLALIKLRLAAWFKKYGFFAFR